MTALPRPQDGALVPYGFHHAFSRIEAASFEVATLLSSDGQTTKAWHPLPSINFDILIEESFARSDTTTAQAASHEGSSTGKVPLLEPTRNVSRGDRWIGFTGITTRP